ncbi:MAG: hypothetical protein IT256_04590 [Chitinophagaceae bacterium]|nr:hypothetical protein [Chitinophagaceae bacterium]
MEDLIQKLKESAGINDEQAAKAIETVVNFIKEKFPPMMHGAVDSFINSDTNGAIGDDGLI